MSVGKEFVMAEATVLKAWQASSAQLF